MPSEFKLPVLAENVNKVTVTRVFVAVGDTVKVDQPIVEIETDKAATEVPSSISGTVLEVRAKEGDTLSVGDVVIVLDGAAAAKSEPAAPPAPPKAEPAKPEAPKATAPAPKPATPAPRQPERTVPPAPQESAEVPAEAEAPAAQSISRSTSAPVPASPSVRRLAREIGIDISQVPGSGPDGRITMEDVKVFSRQVNVDVRGVSAAVPKTSAFLSDSSKWGEVERQAMNSVRRRTAENLAAAWATIPHVTQFDKADVTQLETTRKQYSKIVEAAGGKLTVTAILVKVLAAALKKYPQFNASVDMEKNELIFRKYYNIGIAVDTDRGLIVPVVHNVDRKSVTEIAVEIQGLAERARERKSRLDEMQGATFTISNLGGVGGTSFTPIINPPEVAILGISTSHIEPVYENGQFVPRTMLPLSLSYDHRIIDGADAARFLRWVCLALEQPFLLFLEA